MTKYLCVCGQAFTRKRKADDHVKIYEDAASAWPHHIMKKKWRTRLIDFVFDYPWKSFFRVSGAWIIFQVIVHHYHIDFRVWEGLLISISLVLILS